MNHIPVDLKLLSDYVQQSRIYLTFSTLMMMREWYSKYYEQDIHFNFVVYEMCNIMTYKSKPEKFNKPLLYMYLSTPGHYYRGKLQLVFHFSVLFS